MAKKSKVKIFDHMRQSLRDALAYERGQEVDLRVTEIPARPKAMRPEVGLAATASIQRPRTSASGLAPPPPVQTTLPSSPPVIRPSPLGWAAAQRIAPSCASTRAPLSNRTLPSPSANAAWPSASNRQAVT